MSYRDPIQRRRSCIHCTGLTKAMMALAEPCQQKEKASKQLACSAGRWGATKLKKERERERPDQSYKRAKANMLQLAATIILLLADRWSVYPAAHYSLLTVSSIILLLSTGTSDLSVPPLYVFCARAPMSVSCSHGFSPPFSHMRDGSGERRPASSSSHDRAARIIPFHRSASERLPHLGRSIQRGLPP